MKRRKHLINLWRVFLIGVLATLLPQTAGAWEGSGASYDPYLIKSIADMTQLANDVNSGNSYAGKHILLTEDLTYTSSDTYTVIGNETHKFEGFFDGGGKTIKGIRYTTSTEQYIGIFGSTNGGGIAYLNAVDCQFTSTNNACAAIIVGKSDNYAIIQKNLVEDCVLTVNNGYAAGIDAYPSGSVESCGVLRTTITVKDGDVLQGCAGGIIGFDNYNYPQSYHLIQDCTIQADYAGGIIGKTGASSHEGNIVEDCTIIGKTAAAGFCPQNGTYWIPGGRNNLVLGETTIKAANAADCNAAALFAVSTDYAHTWQNNYYDINGDNRCVVTHRGVMYYGDAPRGALNSDITPDDETVNDGAVGKLFYKITLKTNPTGIGGASSPSQRRYLAAGESMDVTAEIAPDGYAFTGWTTSAGGTFDNATMEFTQYTAGTDNVTLTANYKKLPPASADIKPNNRTYDGTKKDLVTIGTITGGYTGTAADIMFFETATSDDPIEGIPQATDAGTYEVYYIIQTDGDHVQPEKAKVTITISKAPLTAATLDKTSLDYTGAAQTVNVTSVKAGTLDVPATAYTVSGNTQTAAGTYTVTVTAKDNSNFSGSATVQFKIVESGEGGQGGGGEGGGDSADDILRAQVKATGYEDIYDGKAHGISVTGPSGATIKYGEEADKCTQNTSPAYTNAGTKTVYYLVTKDNATAKGSAVVKIAPKSVIVKGITAEDKNYDGTVAATLHLEKAELEGVLDGDQLTISAKGEFKDVTPGANKTVYILNLTLGGDKAANYTIDAKSQKTTTATIHPNLTSGIRVIRNTDGTEVPNSVFLRHSGNGMKITTVDIYPVAPVGVSVYIPATVNNFDEKGLPIASIGYECLNIPAGVEVTDIYMPYTEDILTLDNYAFRLNQDGEKTARIHVPLHLLDDYALCNGLKAEYLAGKVMTTVTPTTELWTFSSGVDVVLPDGMQANICRVIGPFNVASDLITSTTANVHGTERIIVKANNGVMMKGEPGDYDLVAWPSADRKSGMKVPTNNAMTYHGNELEPVIVGKHYPPSMYYILYENEFHELESDDETSVTPCHAVLPKGKTAKSRTLGITATGGTTGIYGVSTNSVAEDDDWFDLHGRKLSCKPTRSGLYIHNGKKEIIK